MPSLTLEEFTAEAALARAEASSRGAIPVLPLSVRLLADQLTPVLAYRRLVAPDQRRTPSFLFESVENGDRVGRYSIMGARPSRRIIAKADQLTDIDCNGADRATTTCKDPMGVLSQATRERTLIRPTSGAPLPSCVLGGWFGYAAYDTVRYTEPGRLPFQNAPHDDRNLPDLEFGFYDTIVVFDHAESAVHVVRLVTLDQTDPTDAYNAAIADLEHTVSLLQRHSKPLPLGRIDRPGPKRDLQSNITRAQHRAMVEKALEYIRAGDIFQVVLGQRFEKASPADPFDVYRALRSVNPSPYMVYMQTSGCVLVASSPEILCRVRNEDAGPVVTNRPLAGTRRRGDTPEEDLALQHELLADPKERAEHIMLVDLGRNDVGRVAAPGTVDLPGVMQIERYSHVMHISSTVTGVLRQGLDAWDALRAALPVGTISGAPKVRAMQIIDEIEPTRRGPYGGGIGYAGLEGEMDIALALRTIVVGPEPGPDGRWLYHLQAAGGIVADSDPDAEFEETVNKAAALARAIELAETAFSSPQGPETISGSAGPLPPDTVTP